MFQSVVTRHWKVLDIEAQSRGPGRFDVENGPTVASKWWTLPTLPTLPTVSQHKLQYDRAAAVRTQRHNCLHFLPSFVSNARYVWSKTLLPPCHAMKKLRQLRFSAKHRMKSAGRSNVRGGCKFTYSTNQYGNMCQSVGQSGFPK